MVSFSLCISDGEISCGVFFSCEEGKDNSLCFMDG